MAAQVSDSTIESVKLVEQQQREPLHPRCCCGADGCQQPEKLEESRIEAFINELAEREGYDLKAKDERYRGGGGHASLLEREAHATAMFKQAVRMMLRKHGLVFA